MLRGVAVGGPVASTCGIDDHSDLPFWRCTVGLRFMQYTGR